MFIRHPLFSLCLAAFLLCLITPADYSQSLDVDNTVPDLSPLEDITPRNPTPEMKNPYLPDTPAPDNPEEQKPFELKVTQTRFLPPAMYGRWSVTAKLVKTDIPGGVPELTYNNWALERIDDSVYISNIDNGAQASISVDAVKNNTATFHHKVLLPHRNPLKLVFGGENVQRDFMIEQPTVTVDGDRMIGKTVQRFYHVKKGEVKQVFTAEFLIHAERLTDGRVKLGRDANDLEFEIEDIQDETNPASDSPETVDSVQYAQ